MKTKKYFNPGFMELLEEEVKTRVVETDWMKKRKFSCAKNIEEVREYVDSAIEVGRCVLDLETTGLDTRIRIIDGKKYPVGQIVGFGLCFDPMVGYYIPINHIEGSEYNLPGDLVIAEIKRLVLNCVTIYHNAKFDLSYLKNFDIILDDPKQFEDTLLMAYLHDSGRKDNRLKELSSDLLNQPMIKFNDIAKEGKFALVSPMVGYFYGASDAVCTMDLYNFFKDMEIFKIQAFIYNVEKHVTFVVMDMEANLVRINVPYLTSLKEKAELRLAEIEQEIYQLVGSKFNMGSPQQLGKVLFEDLKYSYPEKEKTKSGQYSTDSKTLEKIADVYPIVKKIIEYRGLEKVLTTYINNLLKNHDENGCVKLSFKQTGTDTGRFSSPGGYGIEIDGTAGVNVQSIPKMPDENNPDIDMRKAFIAREGKTIVAIDYANEEMRVATNISQETAWIESLNKGIDFHTATGAIISGKSFENVTKAERKIGKTVNFLALYLGGPFTLAANAKISVAEAKKILATFFAGVPKLKKWIDSEIKKARKLKYVRTLFGRTRPLAKYYESGDKGLAAHADRCAVNTCIQGISADIMKIVMAKINTWLTVNNLHDDIKILITMHDELVFEISTDKIELYVPEIVKIMELKDIIIDRLKWTIPLEVDVKYGDSWKVNNDFFKDFPELKARLKEPLIKFKEYNRYSILRGESSNDELPVEKVKVEDSKQEIINKIDIPDEEKEASKPQHIGEEEQDVVFEGESDIDGNLKKNYEIIQEEPEGVAEESDSCMIYTIKNLSTITLRWLNDILLFLIEQAKIDEKGMKKILKIRDQEGNSLLVSEYKINTEHFIILATFFGI